LNIEYLDHLKGKCIESAILISDDKDRVTGAFRDILVIRFDDGSKLIVKSYDIEEYASGFDIKYVVEGEKK